MSDNDTIPKKSTSQINKAVFFTALLQIVGGDKLIIPFC